MKRKITLIAAAMTVFSVVVLASVVYGYRVSAEEQAASSAAAELQQQDLPIEFAPLSTQRVTPQEAAAAAGATLGRADPFSVQLANYNGVQAYMVTFPDGAVVYMSTWGKVLAYTTVPAPAAVTQVTEIVTLHQPRGEGKGRGGGGQHESEHESSHEGGGDD